MEPESTREEQPEEVDRPAAWWSWPTVLLSVLFIGGAVFFDSRGPSRQESKASVESGTRIEESKGRGYGTNLALMKLEGQVVIAASVADPNEAEKSLEGIRKQVQGDPMNAAYLLLENFVADPEGESSPGTELEWGKDSGSLRQLTEKAIESGLTEAERDELTRELGWFAELAPEAASGKIPGRSAIVAKSVLVMSLVGLIFFSALIAIIGGAVLLFLLVKKQREGGQVLKFSRERKPQGILLECFALYLGTMALGEWFSRGLPPGFSPVVYGLAVVIPLLWPIVRGVSWRRFMGSMGWHRGNGVLREVGAGIIGYAGVLAIASIGILLTLLLGFVVNQVHAAGVGPGAGGGAAPVGPVTHPIIEWIYEGDWKVRAFCFLLAAGFAPLFEELFFRGALHRALRGRFRFLPAALITGLIFAALHPQGWMGIPALASIGVGFSLLREWRDSLIAPMVAHAINNGVLVGLFSLAL